MKRATPPSSRTQTATFALLLAKSMFLPTKTHPHSANGRDNTMSKFIEGSKTTQLSSYRIKNAFDNAHTHTTKAWQAKNVALHPRKKDEPIEEGRREKKTTE